MVPVDRLSNPPDAQSNWLVAPCTWPENGWQRSDEPRPPQRTRQFESSCFCGVYAPGDEYEMVVQNNVSGLANPAGVETTRLEDDIDVFGRATRLQSRLRPSLGAVEQPTSSVIPRQAASLIGRDAERSVLSRLVDDVRGGASRALVVHGEAGMGKTALLEYVAGRASDCRVLSVAGVQAEIEFGFAALHQLCVAVLDHVDAVPAPQREALRVTFGIGAGPVPDRFLVGLAVLSLLAEVAAERPLLCLIDDEQWLDQASAQVLAFVARRLGTELVGVVFGARTPSAELASLPELAVAGLADDDAKKLLGSWLTGPVDPRVLDRIVAEAGGNPLALLELPRGLTAAELAGGFGMPGASALPGSVAESFRRRADALPPEARLLLLLAAAEPLGDAVLLWRAAALLGIGADAARPAADAGLAEFGARVRFRHPLARSAACRAASAQDRQLVHGALAEATDPATDPDRRAWHLGQAAPGPDADVASELERSADRAQARGDSPPAPRSSIGPRR